MILYHPAMVLCHREVSGIWREDGDRRSLVNTKMRENWANLKHVLALVDIPNGWWLYNESRGYGLAMSLKLI
jgi:hypothetical protein